MDPADTDEQTSYPVNLAEQPLAEAKDAVEHAEDPTVCCTGGRSCLFYAVQRAEEKEALELINFVLDKVIHLDCTTQDDFGQTPLFYAAREGYTSCLQLLVERCKLDISHVDNAAQTPLFYAARDGRIDAVIWLVESGADINHLDANGETPLFYAARDGREDTVYKMIELGADLTVRNKSKAYPSAIARKSGHRRLATELDNLRKQREAPQSGSSSTKKAEAKRRPARKSASTSTSCPATPRATRRKRPLRGGEDTVPSAKRRGRGRGAFDDESVAEEEGSVADEDMLTASGVSSPASVGGAGRTASKSVLKESPVQSPKQTPRSIASSPVPSEDEHSAQPPVSPSAAASVVPNGRRGGKGPLDGHKPIGIGSVTPCDPPVVFNLTKAVPDESLPLGERQVYQLQFLAPGKAWSFATVSKLEEFEALYPTIAAWDKSGSLPEVGLTQDPYRTKWHEQAHELMQYLNTVEGSWLLDEPVDPEKWGITDYFDVVKKPMDFSTIRQRLAKGSHYRTVQEFIDDLELVFYNCILYNSGESDVGQLCSRIRASYLNQARRLGLLDLLEAEERRVTISKQVVANALTKRNNRILPADPDPESASSSPAPPPLVASQEAPSAEICAVSHITPEETNQNSTQSTVTPEVSDNSPEGSTEFEAPLPEEHDDLGLSTQFAELNIRSGESALECHPPTCVAGQEGHACDEVAAEVAVPSSPGGDANEELNMAEADVEAERMNTTSGGDVTELEAQELTAKETCELSSEPEANVNERQETVEELAPTAAVVAMVPDGPDPKLPSPSEQIEEVITAAQESQDVVMD